MRSILALLLFVIMLIACQESTTSISDSFLDFKAVEIPAPSGSKFPYLVSKSGKLYMSWLEEREDSSFLKLAFLDHAGWSNVAMAAKGKDWFVNWADFPEIFVTEDGEIFVHHLSKTGKDTYAYGVEVAQKDPMEMDFLALGNPYEDTSQTEHGFVSFFSVKGEGTAMIWLDGRKYAAGKEEMSIRTVKINSAGEFYGEGEIDGRTCDCCQTDAVSTEEGAIVVYRDRSSDEIRDIYRSVYHEGTWSEPKPVAVDNWKINGCPVNGPAVDARGNKVAVAWFTAANDSPKVKIAISQDGGKTFGAAIQADAGSPIGRVDIIWTDEQQVYVSWVERNTENEAEVMIRAIHLNGELSKPQIVGEISGARASGFPILVQHLDKVYVTWTLDADIPEIVMWEGVVNNEG